MKRLIWEPAVGEDVIDGNVTVTYTLPTAGVSVCDAIVPDDFTTAGTIYYDSTIIEPATLGDPEVITKELSEDHIHHFAGWER